MTAIITLLVAVCMVYKHAHVYAAYNQYYRGRYLGDCGKDGIYYNTDSSMVFCTHRIAYLMPCAPGTRNFEIEHYEKNKHYAQSAFCGVNLVNYGYTVKHKEKNGGYGLPKPSHGYHQPSGYPHDSGYGYNNYGHDTVYGHKTDYGYETKYDKKHDYKYEKGYGQKGGYEYNSYGKPPLKHDYHVYKKVIYDPHGKKDSGYGKRDDYGDDSPYGHKDSYGKDQGYGVGYQHDSGYGQKDGYEYKVYDKPQIKHEYHAYKKKSYHHKGHEGYDYNKPTPYDDYKPGYSDSYGKYGQSYHKEEYVKEDSRKYEPQYKPKPKYDKDPYVDLSVHKKPQQIKSHKKKLFQTNTKKHYEKHYYSNDKHPKGDKGYSYPDKHQVDDYDYPYYY